MLLPLSEGAGQWSASLSPSTLTPVNQSWGRYHGGRRSSSNDSFFYSPTVISPSALNKPSIMKRYHRRRTCSHTSPRREASHWSTIFLSHWYDPTRKNPVARGTRSHWSTNFFKSLVWLDTEKSRRKRNSNPRSSALDAIEAVGKR